MQRLLPFRVLAVLFALSCAVLGAQEGFTAGSGLSVRVAIVAARGASEALRPVIADAVQYKLRPYRLEVIFRQNLPGEPPGSELAAGAGADFLLDCLYSQEGSQMGISLNWFDLRAGLKMAAAERSGRVDLVLDSLILQAIDELLAQLKGRLEERPSPASAVQAAAAPAPEVAAPAEPGKLQPANPPSSIQAEPMQTPVIRSETAVSSTRFLLTPGLAPFVALGAARYYFPVGIQSLLRGEFLLQAGRGRMGLGMLLGLTIFTAQGTTERSLNFLVPAGASLRYALELGPRWNLLFQLGAGPALLAMSLESQEPLVKVLAYVRSGLGAELALARCLALALEAAYEVYFERPYLIMGFVPSLSLCWRM
jgi:hypothetical protein